MEELILSPKVLFLILVWTLPWKAVALWKAAKNSHKKWFVGILVINTLALLEIIYIFYFAKPNKNKNINNTAALN